MTKAKNGKWSSAMACQWLEQEEGISCPGEALRVRFPDWFARTYSKTELFPLAAKYAKRAKVREKRLAQERADSQAKRKQERQRQQAAKRVQPLSCQSQPQRGPRPHYVTDPVKAKAWALAIRLTGNGAKEQDICKQAAAGNEALTEYLLRTRRYVRDKKGP